MAKSPFRNGSILSRFNRYLSCSVSLTMDESAKDVELREVITLAFEDGTEFANIYVPSPVGERLPSWRQKHDLKPLPR